MGGCLSTLPIPSSNKPNESPTTPISSSKTKTPNVVSGKEGAIVNEAEVEHSPDPGTHSIGTSSGDYAMSPNGTIPGSPSSVETVLGSAVADNASVDSDSVMDRILTSIVANELEIECVGGRQGSARSIDTSFDFFTRDDGNTHASADISSVDRTENSIENSMPMAISNAGDSGDTINTVGPTIDSNKEKRENGCQLPATDPLSVAAREVEVYVANESIPQAPPCAGNALPSSSKSVNEQHFPNEKCENDGEKENDSEDRDGRNHLTTSSPSAVDHPIIRFQSSCKKVVSKLFFEPPVVTPTKSSYVGQIGVSIQGARATPKEAITNCNDSVASLCTVTPDFTPVSPSYANQYDDSIKGTGETPIIAVKCSNDSVASLCTATPDSASSILSTPESSGLADDPSFHEKPTSPMLSSVNELLSSLNGDSAEKHPVLDSIKDSIFIIVEHCLYFGKSLSISFKNKYSSINQCPVEDLVCWENLVSIASTFLAFVMHQFSLVLLAIMSSWHTVKSKGIDTQLFNRINRKFVADMSIERIVSISCAVLTFMLHINVIFHGDFVWDDRAAVLTNPDVLGQRGLMNLLTHDYWGAKMSDALSHKSYRPFAVLSLRVSCMIYGVDRAWGFHLDNVILHSFITYNYAMFCFQLIESYMKSSREVAENVATVAALLFAVHPIHTEPVASIVGRSDLLCAIFYVIAMRLYIFGNERAKHHLLVLASLAGILSTLSKEIGVTVFGMFVWNDIIRFSCLGKACATSMPKLLYRSTLNFLFALVLTAFHLSLHGQSMLRPWSVLENSISLLESRMSRILSRSHVHAVTLWKIMFPYRLCYDYGSECIPHVTSLFDWRNIGTVAAGGFLAVIACFTAKRRDALAMWSLGLLTIPFVPSSNILFTAGVELGERLLYLPSMGFCLGLGYATSVNPLCTRTLTKCKQSTIAARMKPLFSKKKMILLLLCYVFLMASKSLQRCNEWLNEELLFTSGLNVCPRSLKVLNNYAAMYVTTDPKHALEYLNEAIGMYGDYQSAHTNKGIAHFSLGEKELAMESLYTSISLNPNDKKAMFVLGKVLHSFAQDFLSKGNVVDAKLYMLEAVQVLDKLIEKDPKNPSALYLRCDLGNDLGYSEDALRFCKAALEANNNPTEQENLIQNEILFNLLGNISQKLGKFSDAADYFTQGLEANSASFDLLVNLGSLYVGMKEFDQSAYLFEQAREYTKDRPDLEILRLANKGWLMESQGLRLAAKQNYLDAIEMAQPNNVHPQIITNLQNINTYCEQNLCE